MGDSSRSQSPDALRGGFVSAPTSIEGGWGPATPEALPEQRLLVAIVRRAVWDFVLYRDTDPDTDEDRYELAVDAAAWLFWDGEESTDEEGRYTFRFICAELDLDAEKIRDRVLEMTRDDIQRLNNHIKGD